MKRERAGLIFAGLCAVNGAVLPSIAKLTTGEAPALFVATATISVAALAALAMLIARGELGAIVDRRNRLSLWLTGALGTAGANLLFYIGASRSTAIETVLCLQAEPAYSLLLAWLFLGHRPTLRRVVATFVLLGGIALAIGAPGGSRSTGVWALLATPLCWQASHLLVLRRLSGISPFVLTAGRYLHGAWLLVAFWLILGERGELAALQRVGTFVPALLLQGIVLSYLGTLVWYQALIRLDLARTTAIVVPSIPLLSLGASFLILGEVPTPQQALGVVCTAGGVLAFVTAPRVVPREIAEPPPDPRSEI